mmetsp:Transcript_49652/g.103591  ORF Transcript_49652/g.103591 Transcript_49652/m.103591 type:complete len:92 (-) Transcript_49652:130-405(-)
MIGAVHIVNADLQQLQRESMVDHCSTRKGICGYHLLQNTIVGSAISGQTLGSGFFHHSANVRICQTKVSVDQDRLHFSFQIVSTYVHQTAW